MIEAPATTDRETKRRHRFHALDSLRGLAALGVLFTHCLQRSMDVALLHHSPIRLFVNGRCFVIFFFVLSGFVLAMGLWQGDQRGQYITYAFRRLARILPPYMVAGLLAVVLARQLGPLDLRGVSDYFLLLGTGRGATLDPPSWSLVYELRISLLIPLICWAIMQRESLTTLLFGFIFIAEEASSILLKTGEYPYTAETFLTSVTITLRFAVCFYAGIWLAKQVLEDKPWLYRLKGPAFAALGFATYILMSSLLDQFCMIGAVLLIVLAIRSEWFKQLLEHASLQWLGRISYSLYLTHVLILTALMSYLPVDWPLFAKIALAIASSLLFAELFHRLIEAPSIALSRSLKRGPARRQKSIDAGLS
jgi:peptidoglycan/LPS O-acetylase OafA/YrhL